MILYGHGSPVVPYIPHPMAHIIDEIYQLATELTTLLVDNEVLRLGEAIFFSTDVLPMESDVARSQRLGMERKKLRAQSNVLASLAALCDRGARATLERGLATARHIRCVYYVEAEMYDETPLPMRLKEQGVTLDIDLLREFLVHAAPDSFPG